MSWENVSDEEGIALYMDLCNCDRETAEYWVALDKLIESGDYHDVVVVDEHGRRIDSKPTKDTSS